MPSSNFAALHRLAAHIGNNEETCRLLAIAANPCQITAFTNELEKLLQPGEDIADIFSAFLAWCGRNRTPATLKRAIDQRTAAATHRRKLHDDIISRLWLNPDEGRLRSYLASIKVVHVCNASSPAIKLHSNDNARLPGSRNLIRLLVIGCMNQIR